MFSACETIKRVKEFFKSQETKRLTLGKESIRIDLSNERTDKNDAKQNNS